MHPVLYLLADNKGNGAKIIAANITPVYCIWANAHSYIYTRLFKATIILSWPQKNLKSCIQYFDKINALSRFFIDQYIIPVFFNAWFQIYIL